MVVTSPLYSIPLVKKNEDQQWVKHYILKSPVIHNDVKIEKFYIFEIIVFV